MPTQLSTVFISSTALDLGPYRDRLAEVARRLNLHDIAMEHFGARDEKPLAECLELVRDSDYFVGIYAHRYGFVPEAETRSITELEYDAASEAGLQRLIFLVDPSVAWLPAMIDGGSAAADAPVLQGAVGQAAHLRAVHFARRSGGQGGDGAEPGCQEVPAGRRHARRRPPSPPRGSVLTVSSRRARTGHNVVMPRRLDPGGSTSPTTSTRPAGRARSPTSWCTSPAAGAPAGTTLPAPSSTSARSGAIGSFGSRSRAIDPLGIWLSAYGSPLCVCRVTFTDGEQVVLSRFLNIDVLDATAGGEIGTPSAVAEPSTPAAVGP